MTDTDPRFWLIEYTDESDPALPEPESARGGDGPSILPIVDEQYGGVIAWANTTEQGERIVDALAFAEDRDEIFKIIAALAHYAPSYADTPMPFVVAHQRACALLEKRDFRITSLELSDLSDTWLQEAPAVLRQLAEKVIRITGARS